MVLLFLVVGSADNEEEDPSPAPLATDVQSVAPNPQGLGHSSTHSRGVCGRYPTQWGVGRDGQDVGDAILETFLLDPPPEIPTTNDTLRVEFVRFLRPEQHFPSLEALRSQLAKDTETARQLFNV